MLRNANELAKYFASLPADAEIICVWFEKEEAEMFLDRLITKSEWKKIADNYDEESADDVFANAIFDAKVNA